MQSDNSYTISWKLQLTDVVRVFQSTQIIQQSMRLLFSSSPITNHGQRKSCSKHAAQVNLKQCFQCILLKCDMSGSVTVLWVALILPLKIQSSLSINIKMRMQFCQTCLLKPLLHLNFVKSNLYHFFFFKQQASLLFISLVAKKRIENTNSTYKKLC